MRNFKMLTLAAIASVTVMATAGTVSAANPHFVKGPTASVSSTTGELQISFKAAGYGSGSVVGYTIGTGAWSVTLGCVNKGGNEPSGLRTLEGAASSTSGTLEATRTGQITATVTTTHPELASFRCPSRNMTKVVLAASYSNVTLSLDGIPTKNLGTVTL